MQPTSSMVRLQAAANAARFEWGNWTGATHAFA